MSLVDDGASVWLAQGVPTLVVGGTVRVDELAGEVVDRRRSARSLSWLRASDAAELDSPAETERDADVVVAPYR